MIPYNRGYIDGMEYVSKVLVKTFSEAGDKQTDLFAAKFFANISNQIKIGTDSLIEKTRKELSDE